MVDQRDLSLFSVFFIFFFFSSRRRHTRLQGDWSSDVCSSDLFKCACSSSRRSTRNVYWWKMCSFAGSTAGGDRKSTRLNSSHLVISYAVFCLKKKKTRTNT